MLRFSARHLAALTLALLGAATAADGADECPVDGGGLLIAQGSDAEPKPHYNWFLDGADRERGAALGMLEPLFVRDPKTGQPTGWLATHANWNDDYSEVEIRLRHGVHWSDGTPFTAEDVALSVDIARSSTSLDGVQVAAIREQVVDVRVRPRNRVVLELAEPNSGFVTTVLTAGPTDAFTIVPAHLWRGVDHTGEIVPPPLGTGPYVFDPKEADRPIWRRDSDWWGAAQGFRDLPEPDHIAWRSIVTTEDRARSITRGCSDIAAAFSPGVTDALTRISPFVSPLQAGPDAEFAVRSHANWTGWDALLDGGYEAIGRQSSLLFLHALRPREN